MKPILNYSFAKNEKGEIIAAGSAVKGKKYVCLTCDQELTLRKSEKKLKRPHFSHRQLTTNCTPESAIHFAFKTLLYKKIEKSIQKNEAIEITWDCKYCNKQHSGNLLKKAKEIKLEFPIKGKFMPENTAYFQPDIVMLDENNRIFSVIEVIVTHEPEPELIEFYNKNKITYIFFNVSSSGDLKLIKGKKFKPSYVHYCENPRCNTCFGFKQETFMTIVDGKCELCKEEMKVAIIEGAINERGGQYAGPDKFYFDELKTAVSKGVNIVKQYSKAMGISYLANTCKYCNAFVGNYNLYHQFYLMAMYGNYSFERFSVGYHCNTCD
jgi:hypothetical protein